MGRASLRLRGSSKGLPTKLPRATKKISTKSRAPSGQIKKGKTR